MACDCCGVSYISQVRYQAILTLTGYMELKGSSHFVGDATYFIGQK